MTNLAHQYQFPFEYCGGPETEMIDGVIVAMAPTPNLSHQRAARSLRNIFSKYLKGKSCELFDNFAVHLSEENYFVPDMMVVCNKDIIKNNGIHGAPDLVVEILSPSTAKYDKGRKMDIYGECGVKEYWLVDTANHAIEVYLPKDGRLKLDDIYAIYPDWMLEMMSDETKAKIPMQFKTSLFDDLLISVEEVFEDIL